MKQSMLLVKMCVALALCSRRRLALLPLPSTQLICKHISVSRLESTLLLMRYLFRLLDQQNLPSADFPWLKCGIYLHSYNTIVNLKLFAIMTLLYIWNFAIITPLYYFRTIYIWTFTVINLVHPIFFISNIMIYLEPHYYNTCVSKILHFFNTIIKYIWNFTIITLVHLKLVTI